MAEPQTLRAAITAATAAAMAAGTPAEETVARVCEACVELLSVDGVCVSVMADEQSRETIYASDDVMRTVEELQFTLGEGPCTEAFEYGRLVLVPDLAEATAGQWPVFASMIGDHPVRAVFALPIAIGVIRLGAMDLYRSVPGPLGPDEVSAALHAVDVIALLLVGQADDGDDGAADPDGLDVVLGDGHMEVHQATGMLTVALGLTAQEAFVRLRAYAFASGRLVGDIAQEIVSFRLPPEDIEI